MISKEIPSRLSQRTDKHKGSSVQETDVFKEPMVISKDIENVSDDLVDNPSKVLFCCLCKVNGERKVNIFICPIYFIVKWKINSS